MSPTSLDTRQAAGQQRSFVEELHASQLFPVAPEEELIELVSAATEYNIAAGTIIVNESESFDAFLILLDGRVRISRTDGKGNLIVNKAVDAPSFMGEVQLLTGTPSWMSVSTETAVRGLRLERGAFWQMLARCARLRDAITKEMTTRIRGMQVMQTQQDKMAMLGTMTAGLMHELNNPGAAARRAAAQLRGNLRNLHHLARGFSAAGHTQEQRACLTALQERVLATRNDVCLSSMQQSDAEEAIGEWLDAHGMPRAWEAASAFVSSGIELPELECLAAVFTGAALIQPVEWLEATASSMQMVGLVEESVTRVAELAQAVKTYVHEGQGGMQDVDVNSSIHATMVMLKYKLREKNIGVQKEFGAGIPRLHCFCSGLNQVWTNLLDNSIDAVPAGGHIGVRTSVMEGEILVAIRDDGPGISPEDRERIFEPFFTTKSAGKGSGLGLGIVQRILENYKGRLTVESRPGFTEFTVHLPESIAQ